MFQQLLLGLQFIHSKSIVHKDIKPSNIMVMPDGVIKISDFGVAEVLSAYSDSDACGRTHGSPAFQCPQIAAGKDKFDGFKSDVWSAGVTLYAMLKGRLPFTGKVPHTTDNPAPTQPINPNSTTNKIIRIGTWVPLWATQAKTRSPCPPPPPPGFS